MYNRRIMALVLLALPVVTFADGDPTELDDPSAAPPVTTSTAETGNSQSTLAGGGAQADEVALTERYFQFYASDKTAEFRYAIDGPAFGLNSSRAYAGFLFTEDRDNVLAAAILYDTELDVFPGLTLSFGPTALGGLLGEENQDVIGFGFTIEGGYLLPVRQFPLNLSAAFSYAPDILTFGQSDRIIDATVRAGLPLRDNIEGFVGFRFLQFDTRPGDEELDKRLHLGIRIALQ